MTKSVCCLFLALGLAACAPKKAIVLEETPPTTGTRSKPANRTGSAPEETEKPPVPLVNQQSGIRIPDLTNRLPDKRDMTATAPPTAPGGGVIATPPTADKRNGE